MSDSVKAASPGNPAQLLATPTPASTAAAGSSASGSGTGSTILLQTPPPALTALGAGQIIRAVATGRTADGKTLLDTRFGQFAIDLPITANRGQILRLQIVHAGRPLELLLLSSKEPDEEGVRPSDFSQLRPGATLRGRFRQEIAVTTPAQRASSTAAARGKPAMMPGNSAETRLNLRILSITAPGKTTPPSAADDMLIVGTITGAARGGGTILQTATGSLLLPGVSNAPKGTQVTLQIIATPGTVLPVTAAGAQAQSISALSHGWPALQEAINAVRAADPGQASAVISGSVPTTGPQLAAGLAFFLSAMFGLRTQDWLGQGLLRMLETQRQGDLLTRLTDDFTEFSRLAGDTLGNEWRTVMLPLLHDDVLHQIRLYLRGHGDDDDQTGQNGDEDAGTRFVVEVELSRLGALQLDGLVRPHRFDLMVRSHQSLPAHVRDEIGVLFAAANEEMKAAGQIAFQVTRDFPVTPLATPDVHTVGVFA